MKDLFGNETSEVEVFLRSHPWTARFPQADGQLAFNLYATREEAEHEAAAAPSYGDRRPYVHASSIADAAAVLPHFKAALKNG